MKPAARCTECLQVLFTMPPKWRGGNPPAMMFVQSLYGLSHSKIEDTKEEHLEAAVIAFDRLAEKAIQRVVARSDSRPN